MELVPGLCTALTQETWQKLKDASIRTVADFITKDLEKLSKRLHLPFKDLCSIRQVVLAENAAHSVSAATLYHSALTTHAVLSTGFDRLDNLLDGGLYTGEVTELAGDSAAGKTTICHAASSSAVSSATQSVLYIDTVCSLSPQAILDNLLKTSHHFCQSEENLHSCLRKVKHVQAFDIYELLAVLDDLSSKLEKCSSETCDLKLIIVDSLAPIVYPVTGGGFQYSQGLLSQIGHKLKQLAVTYSLAIVVTNNLVSGGIETSRKAALGKLWSHMPHTRVLLEKCDDPGIISNTRNAILVKSCRQKTLTSLEFYLDR